MTTDCPSEVCCTSRWHTGALGVAAAGVAGSLYLSVGMGLKACPLCFYQRSFLMAVAAVLLVGWVLRLRPSGAIFALTLPLAVSGLSVAVFHAYLEQTGKLECPQGMLGLGSAPQQSLGLFVLLVGLLLAGAVSYWSRRELEGSPIVGGILLGIALGAASIWSAPPMPPAPNAPYAEPLLICRPPYVTT
jgi:hypothetical protein